MAFNSTPLCSTVVTLTDAQIKSLVTTGVEVVPAPGEGKVIVPLMATFVTHFSAGGYTGLDTAAQLLLYWGSNTSKFFGVVYESNGSILSFAGDQFFPVSLGTTNDGNGGNFPPGDETSEFENKPITVGIENRPDLLTDVTGGHGDNSLVVTVSYAIARV